MMISTDGLRSRDCFLLASLDDCRCEIRRDDPGLRATELRDILAPDCPTWRATFAAGLGGLRPCLTSNWTRQQKFILYDHSLTLFAELCGPLSAATAPFLGPNPDIAGRSLFLVKLLQLGCFRIAVVNCQLPTNHADVPSDLYMRSMLPMSPSLSTLPLVACKAERSDLLICWLSGTAFPRLL